MRKKYHTTLLTKVKQFSHLFFFFFFLLNLLIDFRVSASLKEAIQSLSSTIHDYPVIVIATTPSTKAVLTDLHACFLHHLEIKVIYW